MMGMLIIRMHNYAWRVTVMLYQQHHDVISSNDTDEKNHQILLSESLYVHFNWLRIAKKGVDA